MRSKKLNEKRLRLYGIDEGDGLENILRAKTENLLQVRDLTESQQKNTNLKMQFKYNMIISYVFEADMS